MTSSPPPAKKLKTEVDLEDRDIDAETQKALEEIDACQNQIDELNERASEDILKVEQKYNKLRKPFFEKRNVIIKRIPNFWVLAIANHQVLGKILDEDEGDCLHYMSKVEVEEFDDIKMGYKINFHFDSNPYLENSVLTKEFHLGGSEPRSKSSPIKWREGRDLVKLVSDKYFKKLGRKPSSFENPTFFSWYLDNCDPSIDEIAEIIKDDLWPNPLQYFLAPPPDDDTNGEEASSMQDEDESDEERDDDGEDDDDAVVILEEEDYANNEEGDDDEEKDEDKDAEEIKDVDDDEVETVAKDKDVKEGEKKASNEPDGN